MSFMIVIYLVIIQINTDYEYLNWYWMQFKVCTIPKFNHVSYMYGVRKLDIDVNKFVSTVYIYVMLHLHDGNIVSVLKWQKVFKHIPIQRYSLTSTRNFFQYDLIHERYRLFAFWKRHFINLKFASD